MSVAYIDEHLPEVEESRKHPRFALQPPVSATFNGAPVLVYNIGEHGVQIEHSEKLGRFTFGDLKFSLPISPRVISLEAHVAWWRQARQPGALDAWPYRIGLRVAGLRALTIDTLAWLLKSNLAKPDKGSLERKRHAMMMRQRELLQDAADEQPQAPPPQTLDECIGRVRAARAELKANPQLMKTALLRLHREQIPESERELLAIWQHLGRQIDPSIISVVLDLYA